MKFALYASAATVMLAATLGATAASAQSRDTIQIAGSSTVLPFSSIQHPLSVYGELMEAMA